jgi:phospholipid/cholesterol/gamma-HCH transport system substrate-binding protein
MGKFANRSIKLGLMVAGGLVLFAIAIFYLGSKQDLFSSSVIVKSYFDDVKGLMEGNKVQYSGITVGHVSHIEIVNDTTILVEMSVDQDVQKFIRKDSRVNIGSDGLMGSKIVNINPGSSNAQSVADNDVLKTQESIDFQDVLEEAQSVMRDTRGITQNLNEISRKMNEGDGDLAVLLNEDKITTKLNRFGDEMLAIASTSDEILEKVNNGEGDLGRLINDSTLTMEYMQLMNEFDSIATETNSFAEELHQYSQQLNSGGGLMYRLAYDSVMANNIDTTIAKVSNSVEDVVGAANTLENSWVFNLFSKNKNKKK